MKKSNSSKSYFFGFSLWKFFFVDIGSFFDEKPIFINLFFGRDYLKKALKQGMNPNSKIYIWGRKNFPDIENYAHENRISLYRVEDGFIRSIGLGSDLTQPYSLVVDSRGIYFDPTNDSDLEYILQNEKFSEDEVKRAQLIRQYLIEKKLSKYNLYANVNLNFPNDKKIVVVPGQVEDDASIRYGANNMTNLELLKDVRRNNPNAYIVYKPHPDVLVGNRVGKINEVEGLQYCDQIVTEVGIDSVLSQADEVHTMTSLVGFEALLRGIKVITYGRPFYAGWGLSDDTMICDRRTRRLTLDELVCGVYLRYPYYIHPETNKRCRIEDVLDFLDKERQVYRMAYKVKILNWISRKSQMVFRRIKGLL